MFPEGAQGLRATGHDTAASTSPTTAKRRPPNADQLDQGEGEADKAEAMTEEDAETKAEASVDESLMDVIADAD